MVLLRLLRQRFHVDFDAMHVLHMLKESPRGVHFRFARGANVVARFCGKNITVRIRNGDRFRMGDLQQY